MPPTRGDRDPLTPPRAPTPPRRSSPDGSTLPVPDCGTGRQRLLANRAVRDAIVSLAGLVGRPVRNQRGAEIGRLVDVVCRWTGDRPIHR